MAHSHNRLYQEFSDSRTIIQFNGVDITDLCKLNETGLVFPAWVRQEIDNTIKEDRRANKPINRLLRFLRLYRPKYDVTRHVTIDMRNRQTLP